MTAPVVSKGHVYFGAEDPKDSSITIKQNSPGFVQIHLGFLQYHHIYNVSVDVPKKFFLGYDTNAVLDAAEKCSPNVNCKIISIEEKRDHLVFLVEFHAEKEGLVKECLKLPLDDDDVKLHLEFNARVLGTGKGTPLLKNGIKCIGVNDEMSEASDWQG